MTDESTQGSGARPPHQRPIQESAMALRGRILHAALTDRQFFDSLVAHGKAAVERKFGPSAYDIRVHAEAPREFTLLIPTPTPDVLAHIEGVVASYRLYQGGAPTRTQLESVILKKAFEDKTYRNQLERDVRVTLVVEHADECVVVLPSAVVLEQLTEQEIEAIGLAVFPVSWIVAAIGKKIAQDVVVVTVGSITSAIVGSQVASPEARRDVELADTDDKPDIAASGNEGSLYTKPKDDK
jgi:hypothetical protein